MEFLGTVHRQMRMVSGFEIISHVLSMALVAAPPAWRCGCGRRARWAPVRCGGGMAMAA